MRKIILPFQVSPVMVKPLSLSVICYKSGVPIEGEQEGESRPFRGRKGQVFPACEPRKGHFGSIGAKGRRFYF